MSFFQKISLFYWNCKIDQILCSIMNTAVMLGFSPKHATWMSRYHSAITQKGLFLSELFSYSCLNDTLFSSFKSGLRFCSNFEQKSAFHWSTCIAFQGLFRDTPHHFFFSSVSEWSLSGHQIRTQFALHFVLFCGTVRACRTRNSWAGPGEDSEQPERQKWQRVLTTTSCHNCHEWPTK